MPVLDIQSTVTKVNQVQHHWSLIVVAYMLALNALPFLMGLQPINSLQTGLAGNDPPWPVLQASPLVYFSANLKNSNVLENN